MFWFHRGCRLWCAGAIVMRFALSAAKRAERLRNQWAPLLEQKQKSLDGLLGLCTFVGMRHFRGDGLFVNATCRHVKAQPVHRMGCARAGWVVLVQSGVARALSACGAKGGSGLPSRLACHNMFGR